MCHSRHVSTHDTTRARVWEDGDTELSGEALLVEELGGAERGLAELALEEVGEGHELHVVLGGVPRAQVLHVRAARGHIQLSFDRGLNRMNE